MTRSEEYVDGTPHTGRVVGYEMEVVCPICEYSTKTREVGGDETVVCGEDAPGSDDHGCGRTLEVLVRPAE